MTPEEAIEETIHRLTAKIHSSIMENKAEEALSYSGALANSCSALQMMRSSEEE